MKIGVFGASGSVGGQTLDVIAENLDKFEAVFLSAHNDEDGLIRRAAEFLPPYIALTDDEYVRSAEKRREFEKKLFGIKSGEKEYETERKLRGKESDKPRYSTAKKGYEFEEKSIGIENADGGYNPVIIYGADYFREIFADGKNPLSLDLAVVAVSGGNGLALSYAALRSGVSLALANKETLVAGGELIMSEARARGVSVIPVDSEHSAVSECLSGNNRADIRRLILTASGGAFRDYSAERLKTVSAKDALNHPTWKMGKKVTIDSATMMNKGLEIIEAMRLFDLPESKIDVVVHPESVVHSMAEFSDNTVMAMMSVPDMRIPISRALGIAYSEYGEAEKSLEKGGIEAPKNSLSEREKDGIKTHKKGGIEPRRRDGFSYEKYGIKAPEKELFSYENHGVKISEKSGGFTRIKNSASALDLIKTASLTFFPPDLKRFPCLKIAREAAAAGGIMPTTLSAANECAAKDFLDGRIGFTDVAPRIATVLDMTKNFSPKSIDEVLEGENTAKKLYEKL
jgi:1-deoxy-D-xylulose 5-phosphate reductoisomerase